VDALRALGAELSGPRDGYLPTRVVGSHRLADTVSVPGDISSQYLSALLIVAPLLPDGLTIEVEGVLRSQPYVELTLDEMRRFGVEVQNEGYRRLRVEPQAYVAQTIDVEGDASAASYFAALVTLHGGRILLENLGRSTHQGDYAFLGLCERLGAQIERNERQTEIAAHGADTFPGFSDPVDMTSMPDVAPTLMMLAPFLDRPTLITGLSTLRVKECDRIAAPARELRKLGVELEEGPDSIRIQPISEAARERTRQVDIETYHDHRIAMCFGVLGSKLRGLRIVDPGCVAKTYPGYWQDWQRCQTSD
jgi:3-phosphoshikimate 1-carboxyvinyltransferase